MPIFFSLLAAVIPMVLYLILIWGLDKYEREPFKHVIKHFLWGAIGAVFFAIIFSKFIITTADLIFSLNLTTPFFASVLVAPIIEEIVKSAYLFRTYRKNYFDNITDGLVYGGAIGLGFGMTENFMYFTVYDQDIFQWVSIVMTRSVFSAVMHGIATATVGVFLAKVRYDYSTKPFYAVYGLIAAIVIHALWNFSLTFEFTFYLGMMFIFILIAAFFYIFNNSIINEFKIIEEELQSEDEKIREPIFNLISNKSLKLNRRLFSNRKNSRKYISFATKLAFRKLEYKNCPDEMKDHLEAEISLIRDKLKILLKTNQNKVG